MWRSLLFVPALDTRLVGGAAGRGADAVVLDLEAGVPAGRKEEARAALAPAVAMLREAGATVAVRVNLPADGGLEEIPEAVGAGAEMIVLPMATAEFTARAAETGGAVPLIPLVEDPAGVIGALAIAEAANTVAGLGFGTEDYSAAMGAPPIPDLLEPAAFQIAQAARAAGREPFVIPDTIADYRDLGRFERAAERARAMGGAGGFAIHPGQVEVLNRVFTPSPEELDAARRVVEAAEAARREGRSVATADGLMVDAPVEARARALLAKAGD